MKNIVVLLGGLGPKEKPEINFENNEMTVIAADSGLSLAQKFALNVNHVVGDMDSVDPNLLERYKELGAEISISSSKKDETDFELALDIANKYSAKNLYVIGGGGLRTDHLLANISVLCGEQTKKWKTTMFNETETIYVCRPKQSLDITIEPGTTISTIPIGSDVHVLETKGLQWALNDSILEVHKARGISNIAIEDTIEISISKGQLAVIISNI
ncbi:MAG: thiamine diphosphokinase [Acidimicrobiia bacterium]